MVKDEDEVGDEVEDAAPLGAMGEAAEVAGQLGERVETFRLNGAPKRPGLAGRERPGWV